LARGGFKQGLQARQEAVSGPAFCTEALQVLGFLLAVNEGDAEFLQGLHEKDKSQFGSVFPGCKHAFAEKHVAQREAIKPAHQLSFEKSLCAVRKAQVVQVYIGFLHFQSQPAAVLTRPWHSGAGADDVLKAGVDAKLERRVQEVFFEAFGDVEGGGLQHKAGVGAMPQNGRFGIPWKNSLAISQKQPLRVQVPSNGEDAVGGGKLRGGKLEGVRIQIPVGGEVEEAQKERLRC